MPSEPLAAFPPRAKFILPPRGMTQIFIERQHGAGHDPRIQSLQYVEGRTVQIAIDVRERQRLILLGPLQKIRYGILEQSLVKIDLPLQIGDRSSGAVRACRFAPPRVRQSGERIESVHGNVEGDHLLYHPYRSTGPDAEFQHQSVLVLDEGLRGVQTDPEHIAGAPMNVVRFTGDLAGVPTDVSPRIDEAGELGPPPAEDVEYELGLVRPSESLQRHGPMKIHRPVAGTQPRRLPVRGGGLLQISTARLDRRSDPVVRYRGGGRIDGRRLPVQSRRRLGITEGVVTQVGQSDARVGQYRPARIGTGRMQIGDVTEFVGGRRR
mmetsp:Transcript_49307/g.148454  ORF Transcript_49307/g.148454 Transcript_49307/m.148454 type:complete len:323 (-) Transcript_49307:522-1490(-)